MAWVIANLFVHHELISTDYPAVRGEKSFAMVRLLWAAWELLDLHPRNWRRIVMFGSFAVPCLLMWLTIIAFLLSCLARYFEFRVHR